MIPIVTTVTERYLPGLKALYNSFKANSAEGFDFHVITSGTDEFAARVRDLGFNVIHDPPIPAKHIPVSERWPQQMLYHRLLIPDLFADRPMSVYVDADSLILQSLMPLVETDFAPHPVAATSSRCDIHREITGLPKTHPNIDGPISSFFVFHHGRWKEQRILERCIEVMENRQDLGFLTSQQAVLRFVLGDNWHRFTYETQAHAGHSTYWSNNRNRIFLLHFLGTNPWEELKFTADHKIKARKIWMGYA